MKFNLGGAFTDVLDKTGVYLQSNGPKLLVFGGIVGTAISFVMGCVATTKAPEIMEEAKERLDIVHANVEEDKKKKELTRTYLKAGVDLAVLYLPALGIGALSMAAILTSHNMLTKQNAALAAAYTTLDATFRGYRERVAAKYGEETELKLRYGLTEETIEETAIDENGKEKTVKRKVQIAGIDKASDYARYFMPVDPNEPGVGSRNYDENDHFGDDYPIYYLNQEERYLNETLRWKKILFLNEVYDHLGFQLSLAGQTVGWIYDEKSPQGDNFIRLTKTPCHFKHKDGTYTKGILVDFNVDGPITEKAIKQKLLCP